MATIRVATAGDAQAMADIYAPVVQHTAITFELVPPTEADMAARMSSGLAYAPWLVAVVGGEVAAFAYGARHRERPAYQWSVDVSVYVAERHRRRGAGRALYAALLPILRRQGFHAVHGGITMCNPGSIALHEAVGFRRIGVFPSVGYKRGAWHDVGWWQMALGERVPEPAPPVPFAELRESAAVDEALRAGAGLLRG